ncbi:hypothetical protein [Micromonospora sp. NPDC048830]|uniref:hypothetical protein n=1 Tax=Micromonospora sp. NPDC048830 TaxID=3364257 RepID=UPI00371ACF04
MASTPSHGANQLGDCFRLAAASNSLSRPAVPSASSAAAARSGVGRRRPVSMAAIAEGLT